MEFRIHFKRSEAAETTIKGKSLGNRIVDKTLLLLSIRAESSAKATGTLHRILSAHP